MKILTIKHFSMRVLTAVANFFRRPILGVLRHAAVIFTSDPKLLVTVALTALSSFAAPPLQALSPAVQMTYTAAQFFGVAYFLMMVFFEPSIVNADIDPHLCIVRAIQRLSFLLLALATIRGTGTELSFMLSWINGNPEASVNIVIGILLMMSIFSFLSSMLLSTSHPTYEAAAGVVTSFLKRPRTARDIHRTAAHEAGHVMLYAFLKETPPDLSVTVLTHLSFDDRYRGFVLDTHHWPDARTEPQMRWDMFFSLAGAEAEFAMFDQRADGASDDNTRWLHGAHQYLQSGFGEVYFAEPIGDAQVSHNRLVLNALKVSQVAALGQFFLINKPLLADLATAIARDGHMQATALVPFLGRVVVDPNVLSPQFIGLSL